MTVDVTTHVGPKRVFFVVGEDSGDRLGASLAKELKATHGEGVAFEGLGGEGLIEQGLTSLFDIEDIAVMGFGPVIARLPTILSRLSKTVDAIIASKPDLVVLIDSPDFTHRVARRVRARAGYPHHRLGLAVGLGVACGPGGGHARLYGPSSGVAAVRGGGPQGTWRPAGHLCRPPAGGSGGRVAPANAG